MLLQVACATTEERRKHREGLGAYVGACIHVKCFGVLAYRLYPQYVTSNMVSDWGLRTSRGQVVDWDATRHVQSNSLQATEHQHDQGADPSLEEATISASRGGRSFGSVVSTHRQHDQDSDGGTTTAGRGGRRFDSTRLSGGSTLRQNDQTLDGATIISGRGGRNLSFGSGISTQSRQDQGPEGAIVTYGRGNSGGCGV